MKNKLSEHKVDEIVVSQADNDSQWEAPIKVSRAVPISGKAKVLSKTKSVSSVKIRGRALITPKLS